MKDLTVFVMTHDRGEMLIETIQSVLDQDCHDFKFVVSDNSSNNETELLLKEKGFLDRLDYRKRDREYSPFDHFNMCLSEADTKFFVLFHDDDIMMPDYVSTLYKIAAEDEACVAIGANACFLYGDKKTDKRFFSKKIDMIVGDKKMAVNYCMGDIVPFSSYMYNKKLLGDMKFKVECGKYSDVTWLLNVAQNGNVLWLSKPHMYYRVHGSQDSQAFDFENQNKLVDRFSSLLGDENPLLLKYKRSLLYEEINDDYKRKKTISCPKLKMLFKKSKFLFFKFILKILIKE